MSCPRAKWAVTTAAKAKLSTHHPKKSICQRIIIRRITSNLPRSGSIP